MVPSLRPAGPVPPEVVGRLDRYRPACLSGRDWVLAGPAVRAAVLACGPSGAEDAKGLVSRLCLFLAGPCGWDRTGAPDLASLLGTTAIASHLLRLAHNGKAGKTRENHRADLRRLARGLAGPPTRQEQEARPLPAPQQQLGGFPSWPVPLAAVAVAWRQLSGHRLRREDLEQIIRPLTREYAGCAMGAAGGTIATLSAPALLAAADAVVRPLEVTAPTSPKTRREPEPPRPSRAVALRYAKASIAAANSAAGGPRLAPNPGVDSLRPEVAGAARAYRPRGVGPRRWAEQRPLWERLVVGHAPPSVSAFRGVAPVRAGFVAWARSRPGRPVPGAPVPAEELLTPGLADAYEVELAHQRVPDASRATCRAVVHRALRSLDAREQPATIAYQPVAGPYDPAKCAALVRLARHQPSPSRRRELSFVVGLGLGAGLDGRDLRHVARDSFSDAELLDGTTALAVTVGGTERPRTVVVRRGYEPLVREALALHDAARRGRTAPVLGRLPGRRNITTPVMEHAVTARDGEAVAIEVNRLRATWLVAVMCAPVPLAELLRSAGLRSARSLTDLLVYCPEPGPVDVATALAELGAGRPA